MPASVMALARFSGAPSYTGRKPVARATTGLTSGRQKKSSCLSGGEAGTPHLFGVRGSASGMASADMRSGRETSSLSHGPSKGSKLGMDRRNPPPKASQGS